jgi:hypothetical protein
MSTNVNPFTPVAGLENFMAVMNMCGSENVVGTLVLANPIRVYPVSSVESIEVHPTQESEEKPFGLAPLARQAANSGKVLNGTEMPTMSSVFEPGA